MQNIVFKTSNYDKAEPLLREALCTEIARLQYSLDLSRKRLVKFEKQYGVSSETFIREWASEDLGGKDMEYVEWAGEFELSAKLEDRLATLESIENVTPEIL
jgi:hypothetical protein